MSTTGVRQAAVGARTAGLERRFGDPADPANPLGWAQFLRAAGRGEPLAGAERMLDAYGLNAEFVPRALGGRFDGPDGLGRVMRAVFRRDASLGLGYGMTSFLAAAVVWAAGSDEQRAEVASVLLAGGRLSSVYPEFSRGNLFLSNGFTARTRHGGYLLDGTKSAVNNAGRAARLVVFARTPEHGPGRHTAFLLDPAQLPPGSWRLLPRRPTTGVRGCLVAGIEFTGCPVPADAVLGRPGEGTALARQVFPVTRAAGPSMALGCADTALRTAVAFAHRAAGGRPALCGSRDRRALTAAFADLLTGDCLALVAARAAHLIPVDSALYAAAAKYLLPSMLTETVYDLSVVLGAESYVATGPYGSFAQNLRDLPMIGLGHAGTAACQATIVQQLHRPAAPAVGGQPPCPTALFRVEDDPFAPPLHWDALALGTQTSGPDTLTASLEGLAREAVDAAAGEHRTLLAGLAGALVAEGHRLRERYRRLRDRAGGDALAGAGGCALADRYALVLAGAACLGVWRHGAGFPDAGAFAGRPEWPVAALRRIVRRLGAPVPALPRAVEDRLLHEVLARFEEGRSYDLHRTRLGGEE